jgi:hypothetical protein
MECPEAQPFVSVLYDGEPVAEEAAEHIRGCQLCRRQLHDYAAMGAELKLAGSRCTGSLPVPAWLASTAPSPRFLAARALTARVMVPWFAVGLCAAVILALSVGINLVRAQNPALWFQFRIYPADSPGSESVRPQVVKSGYREPIEWFWTTHNPEASSFVNHKVGAMVSVLDIQPGRVRLAVRARHFEEDPDSKLVERDLGNLKGHDYTYVPGQTLQIPIEGGGTLLVSGEVTEQQPKLAWGYPLEPGANQMILSHFMLVRDQQVLAPLSGMSTMIGERENRIYLYVPRQGLFTFALQPFEGAVKGKASWSQADFTIDDHHFYLLSGSPITGGDQPHDFWVSLQGDYLPPEKYADHVLLFSRDLSGAPK